MTDDYDGFPKRQLSAESVERRRRLVALMAGMVLVGIVATLLTAGALSWVGSR